VRASHEFLAKQCDVAGRRHVNSSPGLGVNFDCDEAINEPLAPDDGPIRATHFLPSHFA
jgi:hypothetical protein